MARKLAPRVVIVTLGCSKNLVDSERIGAAFAAAGWRVCYDVDPRRGDVLILNTCGFIGDAKEESVNYILRAERLRQEGFLKKLIVMGCLAQRYRSELPTEIPNVDAWYGVNDESQLLSDCAIPLAARSLRLPSTPRHFAYLKIAEGCDRSCAFCAIPAIRGRFRSEEERSLLREAEELAARGVKELILVAQELTYYGRERGQRDALVPLLEKLAAIDGIAWLRLHYAYPHDFPPALVDWMAREPKACHYLDIPVQHANDAVLRSMRRAHSQAQTVELIERLRRQIPDIALRTTLIVGYPTEGEREFAELLDFVRWAQFEHLGAFPYSAEEGTHAAATLVDVVPQEEKQRRYDELMRLQRGIAEQVRGRRVGAVVPVLVESKMEEGLWVGRTPYDSPEIDGEVHVAAPAGALHEGEIYPVRLSSVLDYDFEGEVVERGGE